MTEAEVGRQVQLGNSNYPKINFPLPRVGAQVNSEQKAELS